MQTLLMDMTQGIDETLLREAGRILREGGLVAFPTETVYGLGADALNPEASRKIYAAKGRPSDNPLIVHIADIAMLEKAAVDVPKQAYLLAEAFWPGPLTMILNKSDRIPRETTGGLDTVAVRMPDHELARRLITYGGGFIAAPSANASGRPSTTTAKHVAEDLWGKIDAIIDGGPVEIGLESTIIDLTEDIPAILRPGYINRRMLESVVGNVRLDPALKEEIPGLRPKAPGMKYRHYAPRAAMAIVEGEPAAVAEKINALCRRDEEEGLTCAVLSSEDHQALYTSARVLCVGRMTEEVTIARHLFDALRTFDEWGVDRIYAEAFDTPELGGAIMNRLIKAAGHTIIRA